VLAGISGLFVIERILNELRVILVLILLILVPTIAWAGFKDQRLAVIPPWYQLDPSNVVFTPEGDKVAFAARLEDKVRVIFGDTLSKPYDHVRHISISPDGRSVTHNGTPVWQSGVEYRVVNGVETGPFSAVCNPTFSPDSRKVAFEARHDGKWHHAISPAEATRAAAETGPADMHWMGPVFSPDGRLIVSIQRHNAENKSVRLVSTTELREVRRKEYDSISETVYSSDGLRTAYIARRKGRSFVVTSSFIGGNEREGALFDTIYGLAISADGAHVAYGAERGGKPFFVQDKKESSEGFLYGCLPPVFSRDGRTVAYKAIMGEKPFIVAAGKKTSQYDDVSIPALNDDGSVVTFGGLKEGKWRAIVNGKECPAYDYVDNVQFVPGGKHVAFRARTGEKYRMVIVDLQGKVVAEGPLFDAIWAPSFDEAGRLGYGALAGREIWWKVLVID
jgi:hypothetical protein